MTTNINDLVLSIKKTLLEYTKGDLSFKEAGNEYLTLLDRYNDLEKNNKRHEGPDILNGLCYYHNIENYSLLSAVYEINPKGNDIKTFAYYGDNELNSKIITIIAKRIEEIKKDETIAIPPDKNENLLHSINIFPLLFNKKQKLIFICLSSSIYFSGGKFFYIGELLKELLADFNGSINNGDLNYLDEISNRMNRFIYTNTNNGYNITADYFVFNTLVTILDHMGIPSIFEASRCIIDTLKKNYSSDSLFLSLSPKEYIVLSRYREEEDPVIKRNRIKFIYRKIFIPFNIISLKIDPKDSIYNLWEKFFVFENYISTGDNLIDT